MEPSRITWPSTGPTVKYRLNTDITLEPLEIGPEFLPKIDESCRNFKVEYTYIYDPDN